MWGRLLLAAACLAGSAALQEDIGVANAVRRDSDFRYTPDPDIVKVVAGAHRSTVADSIWLKTLPNLSREFKDLDFKERWLKGVCDATTDLDPGFLTVYVYGSSWLPLIDKQSDSAMALLEKGLRLNEDGEYSDGTKWLNPYRTRLLIELGMFYYKDRRDRETALIYLRQAAHRPDCDGLTLLMVSSLEVNEKRHMAALAPYLHGMQTGTERMKERYEEGLETLKVDIVRKAMREFEARDGRPITSLDELRDPTLIEADAIDLVLSGLALNDEGNVVNLRLEKLNQATILEGASMWCQAFLRDYGRYPTREELRTTPSIKLPNLEAGEFFDIGPRGNVTILRLGD